MYLFLFFLRLLPVLRIFRGNAPSPVLFSFVSSPLANGVTALWPAGPLSASQNKQTKNMFPFLVLVSDSPLLNSESKTLGLTGVVCAPGLAGLAQ